MKKKITAIILMVVLVLALALPMAAVGADPGLVGEWHFDEGSGGTAFDSAGSNDGAINGASWTTSGKFGDALDFDGSNDYVEVSNLDLTGATGLTIEAWINSNGLTTHGVIVAKDRWTTGTEFRFSIYHGVTEGNRWKLELHNGTSGILSDSKITMGEWTHVVVTNDGATTKFYIDGALAGSGNQVLSLGNNNLLIGITATSGNKKPFNGIIDEVRIYNHALSAEEIAVLANPVDPVIEKELTVGSEEIGIKQLVATEYTFEITYSGPAAKVIDTVPAEFKITNLFASDGDSVSFRTGRGGTKGASRIVWDVPAGSNTLTVTIETVPSPGKGHKAGTVYKPTSTGPLSLNDGATAYEVDEEGNLVLVEVVDPDTGDITLVPVPIVGPSNPLVVKAV